MERFLTYLREVPWIVAIVLLLLSYIVATGVRYYQLSGFRFYIIGESIRALAVVVGFSLTVLVDPGILNTGLYGVAVLALGFLLANQLEYWQEARMRRVSSEEWDVWANTAVQARQSSLLDKLLLSPRVEETASPVPELPSRNDPPSAIDLVSAMSSQFPMVHWLLLGGGVIILLVAFATGPHSNPYLFPSLVVVGLDSIIMGGAILLFSQKRQSGTWLMLLGGVLSLGFLYLIIRLFTYSP